MTRPPITFEPGRTAGTPVPPATQELERQIESARKSLGLGDLLIDLNIAPEKIREILELLTQELEKINDPAFKDDTCISFISSEDSEVASYHLNKHQKEITIPSNKATLENIRLALQEARSQWGTPSVEEQVKEFNAKEEIIKINEKIASLKDRYRLKDIKYHGWDDPNYYDSLAADKDIEAIRVLKKQLQVFEEFILSLPDSQVMEKAYIYFNPYDSNSRVEATEETGTNDLYIYGEITTEDIAEVLGLELAEQRLTIDLPPPPAGPLEDEEDDLEPDPFSEEVDKDNPKAAALPLAGESLDGPEKNRRDALIAANNATAAALEKAHKYLDLGGFKNEESSSESVEDLEIQKRYLEAISAFAEKNKDRQIKDKMAFSIDLKEDPNDDSSYSDDSYNIDLMMADSSLVARLRGDIPQEKLVDFLEYCLLTDVPIDDPDYQGKDFRSIIEEIEKKFNVELLCNPVLSLIEIRPLIVNNLIAGLNLFYQDHQFNPDIKIHLTDPNSYPSLTGPSGQKRVYLNLTSSPTEIVEILRQAHEKWPAAVAPELGGFETPSKAEVGFLRHASIEEVRERYGLKLLEINEGIPDNEVEVILEKLDAALADIPKLDEIEVSIKINNSIGGKIDLSWDGFITMDKDADPRRITNSINKYHGGFKEAQDGQREAVRLYNDFNERYGVRLELPYGQDGLRGVRAAKEAVEELSSEDLDLLSGLIIDLRGSRKEIRSREKKVILSKDSSKDEIIAALQELKEAIEADILAELDQLAGQVAEHPNVDKLKNLEIDPAEPIVGRMYQDKKGRLYIVSRLPRPGSKSRTCLILNVATGQYEQHDMDAFTRQVKSGRFELVPGTRQGLRVVEKEDRQKKKQELLLQYSIKILQPEHYDYFIAVISEQLRELEEEIKQDLSQGEIISPRRVSQLGELQLQIELLIVLKTEYRCSPEASQQTYYRNKFGIVYSKEGAINEINNRIKHNEKNSGKIKIEVLAENDELQKELDSLPKKSPKRLGIQEMINYNNLYLEELDKLNEVTPVSPTPLVDSEVIWGNEGLDQLSAQLTRDKIAVLKQEIRERIKSVGFFSGRGAINKYFEENHDQLDNLGQEIQRISQLIRGYKNNFFEHPEKHDGRLGNRYEQALKQEYQLTYDIQTVIDNMLGYFSEMKYTEMLFTQMIPNIFKQIKGLATVYEGISRDVSR